MPLTRIQTACYCLIASAVVLGAMVLTQIGERAPLNEAQAGMVDRTGGLIKLTTQFQTDSELVYILDSQRDILVAYEVDVRRGSMDLVGRLNLARVFDREANIEDLPDGDR